MDEHWQVAVCKSTTLTTAVTVAANVSNVLKYKASPIENTHLNSWSVGSNSRGHFRRIYIYNICIYIYRYNTCIDRYIYMHICVRIFVHSMIRR